MSSRRLLCRLIVLTRPWDLGARREGPERIAWLLVCILLLYMLDVNSSWLDTHACWNHLLLLLLGGGVVWDQGRCHEGLERLTTGLLRKLHGVPGKCVMRAHVCFSGRVGAVADDGLERLGWELRRCDSHLVREALILLCLMDGEGVSFENV